MSRRSAHVFKRADETAVGLHAAFNLLVAAVFLPLSPVVIRLVERLVPARRAADDPLASPRHLDRRSLETPAIASNGTCERIARAHVPDVADGAAIRPDGSLEGTACPWAPSRRRPTSMVATQISVQLELTCNTAPFVRSDQALMGIANGMQRTVEIGLPENEEFLHFRKVGSKSQT